MTKFTEPDPAVDKLARAVIGAAIDVHRHFGPGFLESVYEDSLCVEFDERNIPYRRQVPTKLVYKGHRVGRGRIDLLVDGRLIIELKTVDQFAPIHRATLMSYLKATETKLGLLMNFKSRLLKDGLERVVWSADEG